MASADRKALVKQATALVARDQFRAALDLLGPLTDETAISDAERVIRVRSLLSVGKDDAAADLLRPAVDGSRTSNPQLWALHARSALLRNDPEEALRRVERGCELHPNHPMLASLRSNVLQKVGRADDADRVLNAALKAHPENPLLWVALAIQARQRGRSDEAIEATRRALSQKPGHPLAASVQAMLLGETGRGVELRALAASLAGDAPPRVTVAIAEAACRVGDLAMAGHHLPRETDNLPLDLTHRVFEVAMLLGEVNVASSIMRRVRTERNLPEAVALRLLALVDTSEEALPESVAQDIVERTHPADRQAVADEAARLMADPDWTPAQGASASTTPANDGGISEHRALVYGLLRAGRPGEAMERATEAFTKRDWDVALRGVMCDAAVGAGRPLEALELLSADDPRPLVRVARARLLQQANEIDAGRDVLAGLLDTTVSQTTTTALLRLEALSDSTDAMERLVERFKSDHSRDPRTIYQFNASLAGALVHERRLVEAARQQGIPESELVARFFQPAYAMLRERLRQDGTSWAQGTCASPPDPAASATEIPMRMLQFWDQAEAPDEVANAMASWSTAPEIEYTRFDRIQAVRWLAKERGRDAARAFQLANKVAEAADYLRLEWLFHVGGFWIDADDRRNGDLGELAMHGRRAVLMLEPSGSIGNNVIGSVAGHPVIEWAAQEARRALLARENDTTWSKTGPGLMTRALATALRNGSAVAGPSDVALVPQWRMRHQIGMHLPMAYKRRAGHWNKTRTDVPKAIRDAMLDQEMA